MPRAARRLSTLPHATYADAFLVDPGPPAGQTPEQWARAMFDNAPGSLRSGLPRGWASLGLKLGSPQSDELVFGWAVRRSTPDFALLGADSRVGMPAELLFKRHGDALLFATLIQHENLLVRAIWVAMAAGHRRIVRDLLEHAAAGERATDESARVRRADPSRARPPAGLSAAGSRPRDP